jgi:AP-2 complex subunit alpha
LIHQAASLLGRFISAKETNIRYLALEAMEHLAALDNETASLVKKHQETVIMALKDPDISIRKRALDLLYGLCDRNNSKAIVSELLQYLATADFAIREELVLTVALFLILVGTEDCNFSRKICSPLLVVCRCNPSVDFPCW